MKQNTKQTLKIFLRQASKRKLAFFSASFFSFFGIVCVSLTPLLYKKFFDALSGGETAEKILPILLYSLFGISLVLLADWLFFGLASALSAKITARGYRDLSDFCFSHLHRHSFSFFNGNFSGSLVKKVGRFVSSFESILDSFFFEFIPSFGNLLIISIVLLWKNRVLGAAMVFWIILFLGINYFFSKFKLKYDLEMSEADSKANGVLSDTIVNHGNVKLFCGLEKERQTYGAANLNFTKKMLKSWWLTLGADTLLGFLMIVLEIGSFYIGIKLWQKGLFTIGDFVLLQSYVFAIFGRTRDFGRLIRHFYQDLARAEEMTEILLTPHEITDNPRAKELILKKGEIKFQNVVFCYKKTRKVIDKINLVIKPGERVAFVGPSGTGKSTIVKLLLRMHDLTAGKILIDGQDISKVKQESLWKQISLVPQEPLLFHRSLLENIRYGRPEASDEDAMRAAKLANCHDFIAQLSEGYETMVGERGIKLSGGERQRIAIARAILRNAPILVLDEATSSLDSGSEQLIQQSLDFLMKGKTTIVIAHRLSTIMKMDRILVIKEGKVFEQGTHKQLLRKKNGMYKQLWNLQAGWFVQ